MAAPPLWPACVVTPAFPVWLGAGSRPLLHGFARAIYPSALFCKAPAGPYLQCMSTRQPSCRATRTAGSGAARMACIATLPAPHTLRACMPDPDRHT